MHIQDPKMNRVYQQAMKNDQRIDVNEMMQLIFGALDNNHVGPKERSDLQALMKGLKEGEGQASPEAEALLKAFGEAMASDKPIDQKDMQSILGAVLGNSGVDAKNKATLQKLLSQLDGRQISPDALQLLDKNLGKSEVTQSSTSQAYQQFSTTAKPSSSPLTGPPFSQIQKQFEKDAHRLDGQRDPALISIPTWEQLKNGTQLDGLLNKSTFQNQRGLEHLIDVTKQFSALNQSYQTALSQRGESLSKAIETQQKALTSLHAQYDVATGPELKDAKASIPQQLQEAASAFRTLGNHGLNLISAPSKDNPKMQTAQDALTASWKTFSQTVADAQSVFADPKSTPQARKDVLEKVQAQLKQGTSQAMGLLEIAQQQKVSPADVHVKQFKMDAFTQALGKFNDLSQGVEQKAQIIRKLDMDLNPLKSSIEAAKEQIVQHQSELSEVSEKLHPLGGKQSAYDGLLEKAQGVFSKNETQASERMLKTSERLVEGAEDALRRLEGPTVQNSANILIKAEMIQKAYKDGTLDKGSVNINLVSKAIEVHQGVLDRASRSMEERAQEIVSLYNEPEFQKTFQTLAQEKPEQAEALHQRMMQILSKSKVGQDYLEKEVVPALNQAPEAKPFWKTLLSQTKKGYSLALKSLEAVSSSQIARLATKGVKDAKEIKSILSNAAKMMDSSMRSALGLKPEEMDQVQDLLSKVNNKQISIDDAKAQLKNSPLGRVAGVLDKINNTLKVANGALAMYELMSDPDIQDGLKAGKAASELVEMAAKNATKFPNFSKCAKFVGKAGAHTFDLALGMYELNKKGGSIDRGDFAGTFGNSLVAAGGAIAVSGLALDASGVGAVAGVPLHVIGGIVAGLGYGVDFLLGDSGSDKWMKEHAPEYYKWR